MNVHESLLTGSQTVQLSAQEYDASGSTVSNPITWTSRDISVMTVSNTGLVTPVLTGSAWIVASSGALKDSAIVTRVLSRAGGIGSSFGAAMVSANDAYVSTFSGAVRRIISPTTIGASVTVGGLPTPLALNSTRSRAYTGDQFGTKIFAINTTTNAVVDSLDLGSGVFGVAVAPGDTMLVASTQSGKLFVVNLPAFTKRDSVTIGDWANAIAFKGDTAYASQPAHGVILEVALTTRLVRTLAVGGKPQGLLVSPNGSELWLANEIGQFQAWNRTAGTLAGTVNLPHPLGGTLGGFGIALNPANGYLYISMSYLGAAVAVVDPVTRTLKRTIAVGGTPRRISFNAAGSLGVVANENGWVDFID